MRPTSEATCGGSRRDQILLGVGLCLLSWLAMQVVHELGHVAGAWWTGGRIRSVVLHPLDISRTDVDPNPHPLPVVWFGPVLGVIIPCLVWLVWRRIWPGTADLFRFFAGFCLIANGAYLASGLWEPVGDAWDLVRLGVPRWQLGLFGGVTIPLGIWMWNGMGNRLGMIRPVSPTSCREVLTVWGLLAVVVTVELIWNR